MSQMRKYLDDGDPPEVDENETDGGDEGEASPEAQEAAANESAMATAGPSGYMPADGGSASGEPQFLPGMIGLTPDMAQPPLPPQANGPSPLAASAGIPPPPPNWLQRTAGKMGLSRPGANTPSGTAAPPSYSEALKSLGKIYDQYPQRQVPNWLERAAAGALGAAAGWSNAARRAAPIDIKAATEPILYPGYDAKVAAWQSQVAPAEKAAEIAGQQAAAGWKGQQIGAESALKGAQLQYYLQRGQYYGRLDPSRPTMVTQEVSDATGNKLHVGTMVPASILAKVYDDLIKGGNQTANQMKVTDPEMAKRLGVAVGTSVPNSIYQAGVTTGNRAPNESQVKDQQLRADYATAVGKAPTAVSDAEMNAARRIFSTSDDLSRASLREFIYKNKRLPNPAEERQIVNRSIQERGAANRAPVVAPTAFTAPITYTDKTGTLLHFDTQTQLDGYKKAVGE